MKILCAAAILAAGLAAGAAGCRSTSGGTEAALASAKPPRAIAVLEGRSGSKLEGQATF